MYKVGICGHFAEGIEHYGGQIIKTRIIESEISNILGSENVKKVDTYGWRKNVFKLIFRCIQLSRTCENILFLPASNGVKVIAPMFVLLNSIFRKKLYYVVIGGWLPELLQSNYILRKLLKKLDGIFVETHSMVQSMKELGFTNVRYLPNFKRLDILDEKDLIYHTEEPFKLCTFSRVTKEKGIEDAIEAVKKVNEHFGRVIYTLDIYGQVDKEYKEKFDILKKQFPHYIKYKGVVNYSESVDVLKYYFLLLFPTHFTTEGIPGTIIDAYAAGLPVISAYWNSSSEVINHGATGFIYNDKSMLEKLLLQIIENPNKINSMKKNCIKKVCNYSPEVVVKEFCDLLNL